MSPVEVRVAELERIPITRRGKTVLEDERVESVRPIQFYPSLIHAEADIGLPGDLSIAIDTLLVDNRSHRLLSLFIMLVVGRPQRKVKAVLDVVLHPRR